MTQTLQCGEYQEVESDEAQILVNALKLFFFNNYILLEYCFLMPFYFNLKMCIFCVELHGSNKVRW